MTDTLQIFSFLFLMLGPFKILGPFSMITRNADPKLSRTIAIRSILFSIIALILAALIGESVLEKFGVPLPILAISGGFILFLVALLNIIQQFSPPETPKDSGAPPTLNMAMNPLAFPTIVTPYGIAAVIIFMALSPNVENKIKIGIIIMVIMAINLGFMLFFRYIVKVMAVILPILGAILGVVQVSLGLMIIYNNLKQLLALG